ncbi:MAG: NAD(P)H-binding protein [Actinomycetota bacterium]
MPVMVVGADHPIGEAIVNRLLGPGREVRGFVSSPEIGARLKMAGVKVAVGDLSDEGHLGAACASCFAVVLVAPALVDGRDLAFAAPEAAARAWALAAVAANVKRAIWVGADPPPLRTPEVAVVATERLTPAEVADRVAILDDLATLG